MAKKHPPTPFARPGKTTQAVGETPSGGGFGRKSCKKCGKSHKPGHPHFK